MKFQPQMGTDKHGCLETLRDGVQLDAVFDWLLHNRFLRFKAKDKNEHLPMNLEFNCAEPVLVDKLYSQLVVTTALIPTFSPGEKGQRLHAPLYAVVRRANPVEGAFWFRGSVRTG